ncbi:MAG: glycosyltransferase family 4 protein [Lachnospiraceae bacterium]|nr:glycosyltransferase family 4 protein [Lachnospiraceae bacterium]
MKNVLIITTVSGFVPQFERNNLKILQNMGYCVHYASNFKNPHYGFDNQRLKGTGIICHQVDFERSPFCIRQNLQAYRQVKDLLKKIPFDFIHCHTPMGGVIGRLAAENFRRKKQEEQTEIKVLYTAHGFHFFRGAPLLNWLLYYPAERWLAHYTDSLITINNEDYRRAKRFHLRKNGTVWKVNGVGINMEAYQNITIDREKKRKELGAAADEFIFLSVGELTKRKNHQVVIRALAGIKEECNKNKVRYFICGEGAEREHLLALIKKNGLEKIVRLLGYRDDIKDLLLVSDCFLFPSKQEGLPVALLEAVAAGKICIGSDIRGNRELIARENLVKRQKVKEYQNKIRKVLKEHDLREEKLGRYSEDAVKKRMSIIYKQLCLK